MKTKFLTLLLMSGLTMMLAGCNKNDANGSYVNVSDNSCSFNYSGGTATIMVSASEAWRTETTANWIEVTENSNYIIVTAAENDGKVERTCEINVIAGSASSVITIYQQGNSEMPVIYRKCPTSIFSHNGEYVCGIYSSIENSANVIYLVLLECKTGRELVYGPYNRDTFPVTGVVAVTDTGDIFMCSGEGGSGGATYFFNRKDLSISFFDEGTVYGCNADGSVVTGHRRADYLIDDFVPYIPYKWVNGVAQELPKPETPLRYSNNWYGGVIGRGLSTDGKIIFGTEWQGTDFFMIWWDEDGNWHRVGDDVSETFTIPVTDKNGEYAGDYIGVKGMINVNCYYAISPSGKWISGWYYETVIKEDGSISSVLYPAFYNTEQGKTYIFWDYPDGKAICAREDGIGFIKTNADIFQTDVQMSNFFTVDIENETVISTTQQWFFDNYGIYPPVKAVTIGFSDDYKIAMFQNAYLVDRR